MAARPNKTDKSDARGIATLLARGLFTTAYIKSDEALRMRLLLTARKAVQRKALDLQTSLRMVLKTFGAMVDRKRRKVVAIRQARRTHDPLLEQLCLLMLRSSETLLGEVARLDKMVARAAAADPVCKRFMEIPGVGPITALTFRAAVDDPTRFKCSRDVAAYFGLTPRRFQSGETDFSGPISRRGDPAVRTALYSAACVLLANSRSKWELRAWGLNLAKRKSFKLAAIACARKLAVLMHRLWVLDHRFEARHQASLN